MSYELVIMTDNGCIVGTYDEPSEANALYKWAKSMGYDIVTRKINDFDGDKVVAEKRFVSSESAYRSGIRPSIDALTGTLYRMELET